MNVPGASNRSLYRMELRRSSASYPEGNFGGNQLLDGSIGLSPLHPVPTIDLHVRGASDFHQSFLWLHPDRAWIAIFRVPGRSLRQSRPRRTRSDPGVMRPRLLRPRDLTVGRKEERRRGHNPHDDPPQPQTSSPRGENPTTTAMTAAAGRTTESTGLAEPAGSGPRRVTSPNRHPPTRSLAFAAPPGFVIGPYDSRTARTPRSVFQDGSGGLPMHVADPKWRAA